MGNKKKLTIFAYHYSNTVTVFFFHFLLNGFLTEYLKWS
jgi:hypothetical protein